MPCLFILLVARPRRGLTVGQSHTLSAEAPSVALVLSPRREFEPRNINDYNYHDNSNNVLIIVVIIMIIITIVIVV